MDVKDVSNFFFFDTTEVTAEDMYDWKWQRMCFKAPDAYWQHIFQQHCISYYCR